MGHFISLNHLARFSGHVPAFKYCTSHDQHNILGVITSISRGGNHEEIDIRPCPDFQVPEIDKNGNRPKCGG